MPDAVPYAVAWATLRADGYRCRHPRDTSPGPHRLCRRPTRRVGTVAGRLRALCVRHGGALAEEVTP